jgi:ssDNA-binding Zn-finger/Zn-ribbon topoisomerase 1
MAKRASFTCPNCGEEVPAGAKACPECGSDEKTGWSEKTVYDGTDIPNPDEIDYQKVIEREGLATPKLPRKRLVLLLLIAVVVLICIVLGALR